MELNLDTLSKWAMHRILAAKLQIERTYAYLIIVRAYRDDATLIPSVQVLGDLVYDVFRGPIDGQLYEFRRVPCFTRSEERAFPKRAAKIGTRMLEEVKLAQK